MPSAQASVLSARAACCWVTCLLSDFCVEPFLHSPTSPVRNALAPYNAALLFTFPPPAPHDVKQFDSYISESKDGNAPPALIYGLMRERSNLPHRQQVVLM